MVRHPERPGAPSRVRTARATPTAPEAPASTERGTGLLGSAAGVAVFLLLLLFAVQLIVNLYATSTVTAAGFDAARSVASRRVDHTSPGAVAAAQARAEQQLRQLLGELGSDALVTWRVDADAVRLHVEVDTPGILPSAVAGGVAFGRVDRTFVVRIEDMR